MIEEPVCLYPQRRSRHAVVAGGSVPQIGHDAVRRGAVCHMLVPHLRMSPAMMARRSSWSPQAKRASESTPRSMAAAIQASKASPRRSRTRVKKAWLSVSARADGPWERVYGERCDSGGCPASAARRSWVMKRPTVRAEWV